MLVSHGNNECRNLSALFIGGAAGAGWLVETVVFWGEGALPLP
jgi:hypothetical protein